MGDCQAVDWETVGWFPEYWERVGATLLTIKRSLLRRVFPQYEEEFIMPFGTLIVQILCAIKEQHSKGPHAANILTATVFWRLDRTLRRMWNI